MATVAAVFSCRSNPFGSTNKSIEEFTVYTSDFTAQTDGGAKAALLEVINGAKATLNCAFSALTLTDVRSALVAKAGSGVQVKIAFDSDVKTSDAGSVALQASGAFTVVTTPSDSTQSQLLYGNNGTGTLRHNFCLADERYIYISTAAPDDAQMRKTPAVSLKIGSPQFGLARDFLRESNMFSQLLFGSGKAKTDFTTKFTALDQVIGAYWGPQETPMDVLGTNLSEATATVDLYSTSFLATNTTASKSFLDVPTVLKTLETAKGINIRKYFSSQALFATGSQAYTLSNPKVYTNSDVRIGPNIFVVDRNLSSAKTFIYTGSLRTQANSSDDSVLIELRGARVAQLVATYLDRIGAASAPVSNTGDTSANLEVVISEIHWMGSYSNALTSDDTDEFIEFYNNTSAAINMSGWKFACTTDGGVANVNSYITLPPGAVIAPGGYFVVARKETSAFQNANHFDSKVDVTNTSRECKLTNGRATPASTYTIQPGFTGDVIDTAGSGSNAFSSTANMGSTQGSPNFIRRSMERINPATSGANTTNWQTNVFVSSQNAGVGANYREQTFASPGAAKSEVLVEPGTFRIVEISVDNSGDDAVELRCVAAGSITGFRLMVGNSLRYTFPSAVFAAGDIIVFHAQAAGTDETGGNPSASADAGATAGYDFWQAGSAITATDEELELTDSGGVSKDYVAWVEGTFATGQAARVETHVSTGYWTRAGSSIAESDLVDSSIDNGGLCLQRVNTGAGTTHTDTHSRSDWFAGTCGLGVNQSTTAPVFNVTAAAATADITHVTVTFNSPPNPTQAQNATNYCISFSAEGDCSGPDLTISGAVLAGNTVTLTTSTQISGSGYRVYITGITAAAGGASLTTSTAIFSGFSTAATILITEINPAVTSPASCDLIELTVTGAGNMNGIKILDGGELTDTALVTFSPFNVSVGDIIVVHFNSSNTTCYPVAVGNETAAKNEYPVATYIRNYDAAWDWYSAASGFTATDAVVGITNSAGSAFQDVIAYSNVDGSTLSGSAKTDMCAIFNGTDWTALASCTGQTNGTIENNAASDSDNLSSGLTTTSASFQRKYNTTNSTYCDGNKAGDWIIYTTANPKSSFGAINNITGPAVTTCP